jgi:hypothetical protein
VLTVVGWPVPASIGGRYEGIVTGLISGRLLRSLNVGPTAVVVTNTGSPVDGSIVPVEPIGVSAGKVELPIELPPVGLRSTAPPIVGDTGVVERSGAVTYTVGSVVSPARGSNTNPPPPPLALRAPPPISPAAAVKESNAAPINGPPIGAPETGSKYIPEFPIGSDENVPIHFFFMTT